MISCAADLRKTLEQRFRAAIADLYPDPATRHGRAHARLEAFAGAAPQALILLAEPWLGGMSLPRRRIFLACCDLHLYARVLDDAVDGGEPCQRLALLRIQPLYWQSAQFLGKARPGLAPMARSLIEQTVTAAARERGSTVDWAAKNHHLLLIPLYLSRNMAFFQKNRSHLSVGIALLQAEDEVPQGRSGDRIQLLGLVETAARSAVCLANAGWRLFAHRIVAGCRGLLGG